MDLSDKLEIVNVSDVGKRRPHNEDSTLSDAGMGLVIVADGMGGYKAGEVASAIAVSSIHHHLVSELERKNHRNHDRETGSSAESVLLKNTLLFVNSEIYNLAQHDPECLGMGTTIVLAWFHDNLCTIAHVGDSRLYRKRQNNFSQITRDHSLFQEVIDKGLYTQEEALINTPKNLVTRAMGIDYDFQVDINEEPVLPGDIYLLCSDGLNDMVNDEEIHLTLSKYSANLVQAANELVGLANRNGGKDNISVILVRALEQFCAPRTGLIEKLKNRFF